MQYVKLLKLGNIAFVNQFKQGWTYFPANDCCLYDYGSLIFEDIFKNFLLVPEAFALIHEREVLVFRRSTLHKMLTDKLLKLLV